MSEHIGSAAGVHGMPPRWVFSLFNPIARTLLAIGVPLGLNGLITIRGRKSGLPRTTPVAIIAVAGRRWVWAPWGDVQWVRNLRAAGRATITVRRRQEEVRATELDPAAARRVLPRHPRPARAEHPVRCLVHPHRRRGRSQPSGGSGRGSAGLRTPPATLKRPRGVCVAKTRSVRSDAAMSCGAGHAASRKYSCTRPPRTSRRCSV